MDSSAPAPSSQEIETCFWNARIPAKCSSALQYTTALFTFTYDSLMTDVYSLSHPLRLVLLRFNLGLM